MFAYLCESLCECIQSHQVNTEASVAAKQKKKKRQACIYKKGCQARARRKRKEDDKEKKVNQHASVLIARDEE